MSLDEEKASLLPLSPSPVIRADSACDLAITPKNFISPPPADVKTPTSSSFRNSDFFSPVRPAEVLFLF